MIGSRLRQLRSERGLSLRTLSAETGLSPTMLSQIERGVTEPSLRTLRLLAETFGQSIATLFEDADDPVVQISVPGRRSLISSPQGHIQYERLASGNGRLEVLKGLLQPGETSSDEPWAHQATECAYVLTGTLTVEVEGADHHVGPGEAITLDSSRPHRYLNVCGESVEFILSVTPPTP